MNYKQKSGYMLLGAGLLAVGIIIGQLIEPDMETDLNGVLEKIRCRELEVVDANGNKAISLRSDAASSMSVYYDKQGNVAMLMGCIDEKDRGVSIYDQYGRLLVGLSSASGWDNLKGSGLTVYDMQGNAAVELVSNLGGNQVSVYNSRGKRVSEMVSGSDNWMSFEVGLPNRAANRHLLQQKRRRPINQELSAGWLIRRNRRELAIV